jgi:hypothetical protein
LGDFGFEMKLAKAKDIEAVPNDVIDHYSKSNVQIRVKLLERTDVLIEGDAESFEFLANLILSSINGDQHSVTLSPKGVGSVWFKKGSTKGLYLHILPCRHGHPEN